MPELLRVDDRADRLDPALGDVERHDADQLAVGVAVLGAGLAVDRSPAAAPPRRSSRSRAASSCRASGRPRRRPKAGCLIAGASPPPSPCSSTSSASSASSASKSPFSRRREEAVRELLALLRARRRRRGSHPARGGGRARRAAGRWPGSCRRSRRPVVVVVEDVVQQEGGPLLRRQRLEHDQEGEGEGVGQLGLLGWIVGRALGDRLGQPLADVCLAPGAGRAQLVDRQSRRDGGGVGPGRGDVLAALDRGVHTEECLLHHVLRLAHAAQHPIGDREGPGPQVVIKRVAPAARRRIVGLVHAELPTGWPSSCSSPSRKPSRQLG